MAKSKYVEFAEKLVEDARRLKEVADAATKLTTPQEGAPQDIVEIAGEIRGLSDSRTREEHGYLLIQMSDTAREILRAINESSKKTELVWERGLVVTRTDAHGNTMSIDKVIEVGEVLLDVARRVEKVLSA